MSDLRQLKVSHAGVHFDCLVSSNIYQRQLEYVAQYLSAPTQEPAIGGAQRIRVINDDEIYRRCLPDTSRPDDHMAIGHARYVARRAYGVSSYRPEPPCADWLPDDHFMIAYDRQVDIVTRSDSDTPTRYLMYVVRATLDRTFYDSGAIQFHAASVARGDAAVLILGPRGAGKTTTMTQLVSGGFTDLMANDRTFLWASSRRVAGMPLALNIGYGMADGTPRLADRITTSPPRWSQGIPADSVAEARRFGSRTKHRLTPAEFAEVMGSGRAETARLGLLLFPSLSADDRPYEETRISASDAARLLQESCYGFGRPFDGYARFSEPAVAEDHVLREARSGCLELASAVPAFRVGWGIDYSGDDVRSRLHELVQTELRTHSESL